MRTTIETIPSQSAEGVWLGSELAIAHLDLDADDLAQLHGQSPFFELLPSPGLGRMYSLLQVIAEWRPGKIFDDDCTLILIYGSEIGDGTATAGPPGQPLAIKSGDFSELGDGGSQVIGQFATMPFTGNAVFGLTAQTADKSLAVVAGKSFREPGAITAGFVDPEQAGTGYTVGEVITLGDFGATVTVDSVDGDGVVQTFHISSGGDPEYNIGDNPSDAHSGEEGHGTGFAMTITDTDAPAVTGELHLEIVYRVVQLHMPAGGPS